MTPAGRDPAREFDERELDVGRRIQAFSQLAGPVAPAPADDDSYRVAYRGVDSVHGRGRALRTLVIALFAFTFEAVVVVWVLQPSHRPAITGSVFAHAANVFVIASIMIMEFLRLVNVLFIALGSVVSRDPVPVPPRRGGRIAFLTTIVPSKEPVDIVRGTLQAALRIRYDGILDVWILDEGDDPAVKAMCRELGVNHFTRHGISRYNQSSGAFKARTKHGNYNAWVSEHGSSYDIFMSVDPDHVPLPNYAERILGYFRDPDVAYVSAPQCYANDETFVTRAAEAQQFLFHSLIQRAANRFHAAMLVGTNNAVRISAFQGVGGLDDSVTEDMATGSKFHSRRNPATRRRWKSVYTPDVLAVGEGPSSWGDFFNQQLRWSRGTFDTLLGNLWRRLPRMRPGAALHYLLLCAFYPSMALAWVFGAVNAILFLTLGVQGISVPVQLWFALYVDAAAIQLWLYLRNRRYNVSPYEAEGSSGLQGMLMSTVASPIYTASFVAALFRLPTRFVVTPKGISSSADHVRTFRRHLQWGALVVAALVVAIVLGHATPAVLMWPVVMLLACAFPPALWVVERIVGRRPVVAPEAAPAEGPPRREAVEATTTLDAVGSRRDPTSTGPTSTGPATTGPARPPGPSGARPAAGGPPPGWNRAGGRPGAGPPPGRSGPLPTASGGWSAPTGRPAAAGPPATARPSGPATARPSGGAPPSRPARTPATVVGASRRPDDAPIRPGTPDATTHPVDRRGEATATTGSGPANGRPGHIERRKPGSSSTGESAGAGEATASEDSADGSDSTVTDIMSRVGRALPVADGHGDRHDDGDRGEPDVRERDESSETTAVRVVALADVADEEPEGTLARRGETTEAS